ncbi:SPOR domain-containing protein [Paracrocinitomix mangrovi]|uniref:SPOR domain-containing protein n=1 Tax=Paracrocinitomix mangrovi TaxID=2862509 RepID=UPI001C8D9AC7|nr:SPOR domain-containing protein [Paracrocinitomix mangrovi]UKN00868.1 SPOR domain-containing protein [Paracrocinitomix mangrovi]
MNKIIVAISFISLAYGGFSQNENWLSFPTSKKDSIVKTDTISKQVQLDYDVEDGNVTIHEDARIEKLEKFVRSGEESLDGVLIDGYRVMIYFDQDKSKAESEKARFMSMYNDVSTYIDYSAPNYRVRVGNFRTKLEAEKLKQEILGIFFTAIVVEDKIQLPALPEN